MTGQGPPTILPVVTKYKYLWQISEGIINGSCPCFWKWVRPSCFPSNEHCQRQWRFFPFITHLDVCGSAKSGIASAYKANTPSLSVCEMSTHLPSSSIDCLCLKRIGCALLVWKKTSVSLTPADLAYGGCEPSVPQGMWRFLRRITRLYWSSQVLSARVNSNFVKLGIALYMIKENSRNPCMCLSEKTFFCVQVSLYHDDFHWAVFSP